MHLFPWRGCVLLLLLTGLVRAQEAPLTFDQVLRHTLPGHPTERAQEASLRATEALVQQAGVKPNPTLQLQTQTDGFERMSQIGMSISQRLELGGKRSARVGAAETNHSENQLQAEIRLAQFRYELRRNFLKLLLAQKKMELSLHSLKLTQHHIKIAKARFEAGDLSGAELATLKVEGERKLAQTEIVRAEVNRAKADLGKFLTDPEILNAGLRGDLGLEESLPPLDALSSETYLALRLAQAKVKSREAQVFLERSLGVSDITLQAGAFVQRTVFPGSSYTPSGIIGGLDDTGPLLQFQIQIPIPINDDNSGRIAAAKARREQAELELQALEMEVAANLKGLYQTLEGQLNARKLLEEQAAPAALESLQAVEKAYKLGFRSQLDLLLAKQTYLETREEILDAGFNESLTVAQLERALGHPLTVKEGSQ